MGTCEGLAETPQTSLWAEGNEGLPREVSVTKKTQSRSTQPRSHASHAETPVAAHTTLRVASVVPLRAGVQGALWHACGVLRPEDGQQRPSGQEVRTRSLEDTASFICWALGAGTAW